MLAPCRQADLINGTLANIIHRYKIYQIPEEPVPQMLVFIESLQLFPDRTERGCSEPVARILERQLTKPHIDYR